MKPLHIVIISSLFLFDIILSICKPNLLSQNVFLNDFVSQQLIPVTTVLVTVSLVNVLKLHLEYTRIEREHKVRFFKEARRRVTMVGKELLLLICASVVVAFLNSVVDDLTTKSIVNFLSIIILVECLFAMFQLIRTAIVIAEEEPIE